MVTEPHAIVRHSIWKLVNRVLIPALSSLILALAGCTQVGREPRADAAAQTPASSPAAVTTGARQDTAYLPPWNFMSLSTGGVDAFLQTHPTYDGRGVMILIFDTGIDMSIPGLQRTSTGLPKVVDAIDFSGSNVVRFRRATITGGESDRVAAADGVPARLHHLESLVPQPVDGVWYVGAIDESKYRSSSVRDFDGDGESTSFFGGLLYRAADGWRVVFDTDVDSSMKGEKPVGSYRDQRETFTFKRPGAFGSSPLTFAPTIDTLSRSVSLLYDMDGHGTHVAGIAAGFGINGEKGFNGIAPGAQLIAGKISADTAKDNTVTGSMKRAYQYAAHLADSLQPLHTPVVVNMSFGIGSAYEGRADIERFMDTLLPAHPNLYVVTSAGNEGPGLSTVGIPASSSRIISVGALLPRGVGHDTYAAELGGDVLWNFSSRGGEVDKPDVVAPGTAVSTITRFAFDPRLSGTSMASPYATGVVALLLSAMRQEDSTWMPTQELVRRVLRSTARTMPEYAAIEQGGGIIDVRHAYEVLRRAHRNGFASDLQQYTISTYSPNYPEEHGPAAFWRSTYVPTSDWRQSFTITRVAPRGDDRDFFRAYELESTAPWIKPVQSVVYIKGNNPAQVDVTYDRDLLKEPGLYSARVIARRASSSGTAPREDVEFELTNTVIVPYRFSAEQGYAVTTPTYRLPAAGYRHFFFAPPAGAAALTFTVNVPKGSSSNVSGWIIDRNGYNVNYLPRVKGSERGEGSNTVSMSDLGSGVIEVVVQADAFEGRGDSSTFSLTVTATMLDLRTTTTEIGGAQVLNVVATNTGNDILAGEISYTMRGFGRVLHDTLRGDVLTVPIRLSKDDGAVWLTPRFTPEAYMHATDILARVIDAHGAVQAEETYNQPETKLFLPNFERDTATCYLQIVFGEANYERPQDIPVDIVEEHVRSADPKPVGGAIGGLELVPYVPKRFSTKLVSGIPIPPGYEGLAEATFKPRGREQTISFPFRFPRPADAEARP
jgi:subtilisin family serine protease